MTQVYGVPSREDDPHSLPDCEVFYMSKREIRSYGKESCWWNEGDREYLSSGWYWWVCFPGCLPDSDPIGPFASEREAIEDAQSEAWQFSDAWQFGD